jgi:hypothetical protein
MVGNITLHVFIVTFMVLEDEAVLYRVVRCPQHHGFDGPVVGCSLAVVELG